MRPVNSSSLSAGSARIGEKSLDVRGKPQQVAVYDFAKIQPRYAEHVDGTGYPGSYRIEADLTKTQKVSLTFEPDGKVQLLSQHFEPDPELGNVSGPYPSRVDPVRNLFPEEVQSLKAGLQGLGPLDEAFSIALERIGGKSAENKAPPAGVNAQHLQPSEGKALPNPGGMRGAGYDVVDKE